MIDSLTDIGVFMVFVGAALSIFDEVKGRSFFQNRGQWLLLAGFLFVIVPKYGWITGVACDAILLIAIALYRSKWWMMTKAMDFGSWLYESSIGRTVRWRKKTRDARERES